MKVSIIIPTYNEEKAIGECLASLSQQTYEDFEIIVVDDGSIDNSKFKIQRSKIQFKTQNFLFLEQKHKGPGVARNLGAKQAKGKILVFIDADMTFDKDFIKNLIKPISEGKSIGTFSKEEYLANKNNVWARCWNINRGLPKDKMHASNYPDTQKVFRAILKSQFEKAGGFDEKAGYTDDWSLSARLGVEAIVADGAVFYHKNPGTLKEVFIQSRWMAKRRYKMGAVGLIIALLRVSFPISLIVGVYKTFTFSPASPCLAGRQTAGRLLPFIFFKIVSDLGQFIGIFEYFFLKKVSK